MEPQAASNRYNSNVWNILPVTTFRTIDLAGKKNSDRLFSRFCAERAIFSEGILHQNACMKTWGLEGDPRFTTPKTGCPSRGLCAKAGQAT
jgi:hypothetical protein